MIDHALQHNSSLHNASQGVDDLLGSGSSILTNLREQRVTLKGVHRRILDVASTLGLSNTLIRLIDKRGTQVHNSTTQHKICKVSHAPQIMPNTLIPLSLIDE
jgi:hypothetical protein